MMLEKFLFIVRISLLILLLSILFFLAENIFGSVLKIQSISVAEKILPCIDEVMPISFIVKKMRKEQCQEVCKTLQSDWKHGNCTLTTSSDSLSIRVPHSEITFSKSKYFYPVFNMSVQQLKRADTLVMALYLIFYMTIIVVAFVVCIYRNSGILPLIYLYLLLLGALWFSLPVNQLPFQDCLFGNKNGNMSWKKIEIEDNLNLQWMEQQPFLYLYKSDSRSEAYFKHYNPHVNWQKISTDFWLCRYDSIIDLFSRIHILIWCILLFWICMYMYILYKVAQCVTLFYFGQSK